MVQRILENGGGIERTPSAASSTFHPHRPVPKPIPIFHSFHTSFESPEPAYASYSRPQRDSLSTSSSSPTSPPASASSFLSRISLGRPASMSPTKLKALRRRDIIHPCPFTGALPIGRRTSQSQLSPTSAVSTDIGSREEESSDAAISSSAETAATSFFIENFSKERGSLSDGDGVTRSRAVTAAGQPRKTVHFENFGSINGDSQSPRHSLLRKPLSFIRVFSIRRKPSRSKSRSPAYEESLTGSLRSYPREPARSSISSPSTMAFTIDLCEEEEEAAQTAVEQSHERMVEDVLDETQLFNDEPLPTSPDSTPSPQAILLSSMSTPYMNPPIVGAVSQLSRIPEDGEEVLEHDLVLSPISRRSGLSYFSTGTSIGPYRSVFRMFGSEQRQLSFSEIPTRADSVTVPDFAGLERGTSRPSGAINDPRPDSPCSCYPPTISVTFPDAESLIDPSSGRRRPLRFGPRPLDSPVPSTPFEFDSYCSTSTALSTNFSNFPFPPNFSSPTPPPPALTASTETSTPPMTSTSELSPSSRRKAVHPRALTAPELIAFLSS